MPAFMLHSTTSVEGGATPRRLVDRPGGAATYHLDVLLFYVLRCYLVVSKRALLLWLKHAVDVLPDVARLFVGRVLDEHTARFVDQVICVVPDAVEVLGIQGRDELHVVALGEHALVVALFKFQAVDVKGYDVAVLRTPLSINAVLVFDLDYAGLVGLALF